MQNAGTALMGMGIGSGDKRAMVAIKQAISSPLLDVNIEGAKGVLFNIMGGPDMTMNEIDEAASIIAKSVDPDADIIFGAVIDEKMMDQIKITIIATKFDDNKLHLFRFRKEPEVEKVEKSEERNVITSSDEDKNQIVEDEELLDDSSEFDIPAFLRKK